ncbi:hypothetical protein VPHG_00071 [Vibrio phage 11895-B1]|uniref:hypothetical protein n=1 Tax=Vibrio phage 11895-B1 TaxID=754075 RepID=UPI0002C09FAE|nr:hypothetical protein VPHG_00071 [Vibrio phage 11895-B1]AGH32138.1 hypothetical protein VPHG_00071 [Vibrio phage 11895-B1]
MKRKIVLGYANEITNKNSINHLSFGEAKIVSQVVMQQEDCDGFPDSRTLELLCNDNFGDFMLVTGSTQEHTQFSNSDAYFPLYLGNDLTQVRDTLYSMVKQLNKMLENKND